MTLKDKKMTEHIEPCDICDMEYTKERCRIAKKYVQDDDPCFCRSIKKIQRLVNKNKKLKKDNTDMFCFMMEQDDLLHGFEEWKKENKT